MKRIIYHLAKIILLRSHGKNRLVKYEADPFLELPLTRRLMVAMIKDGKA